MLYEHDVEIPMRDGSVLRANVYRPTIDVACPVIMTAGPYGKDLHMAELHNNAYMQIAEQGQLLNWETPNPEWWVPRGYAVVRVDQRGSGASPGFLDCFSTSQSEDFYDAIEWAGVQPWSNGKVGLLGVSYYAMSQWQVAALQPPHLAAMIPWEGAADMYRDFFHHGGIFSNGFIELWWPNFPLRTQHGADKAGNSLSETERAANRVDLRESPLAHTLDDEYYRRALRGLDRIEVPLLSAGNWGGLNLHLRGNIEGFVGASARHKWLRVHTGTHFQPFHTLESRAVQLRFFDYWLRGLDNGLLDDAPVRLAIRDATGFRWRDEQEWPLARTTWTEMYLDAQRMQLSREPPTADADVSYAAPDGGVSFTTVPAVRDIELTGPLALRLWVASSAGDMDLFVSVRNVGPDNEDVWAVGSQGEQVPVTKGWLRVSHRELDEARSLPYRPYHAHTEDKPAQPGEVVQVDVEIWPTSMVFAAGHRLVLDIDAHDGVGSGRTLHNHPLDRPPERFAGQNTLYTGPAHASRLLVPEVPAE
ncbi:MAG: CocE/NonD family hydrolase [Chloroflexi bacterium]|nr:CocE/NonD family hydrolase [Chloroflexota bacterium]